MKNKYQVDLLEMKEVHEIPGAWTKTEFINLLDSIDYEDLESIADEELKDMACMALSDLEVNDASQQILLLRFGEKLNKGQRNNLAEELKDDRIWEEYSDLSFHQELFNVSTMLNWAFPKVFKEPDIVRIKLKVTSLNNPSAVNLKSVTKSFIARLLNDGMDQHNIIYRLFDEQIASDKFDEAEHIIWKIDETGFNAEDQSNTLTIFTAWNWVDELRGVKSYESTAFSDGQMN